MYQDCLPKKLLTVILQSHPTLKSTENKANLFINFFKSKFKNKKRNTLKSIYHWLYFHFLDSFY